MFIYGINGRRQWAELQAPDEGGGGGNDNNNDPNTAFQKLLEKHSNDGIRLAEKLFGENYGYRSEIRELKKQVGDLEGKVPANGAVVLTGDDIAAWSAYKALGKPDELKQGLEERGQLQGKLAGMQRDGLVRDVADVAQYKPGVLANLDRIARAEGKELTYSVRDVTQQDGKTVKAAFVKDGDKELPLSEYAQTNWADFLPALTTVAPTTYQNNKFPDQYTGNSGRPPADPVAAHIQAKEESQRAIKNPLLKN